MDATKKNKGGEQTFARSGRSELATATAKEFSYASGPAQETCNRARRRLLSGTGHIGEASPGKQTPHQIGGGVANKQLPIPAAKPTAKP